MRTHRLASQITPQPLSLFFVARKIILLPHDHSGRVFFFRTDLALESGFFKIFLSAVVVWQADSEAKPTFWPAVCLQDLGGVAVLMAATVTGTASTTFETSKMSLQVALLEAT